MFKPSMAKPTSCTIPVTERCEGDESYSYEEASTGSEIIMQSDTSFSGMEQKHSDESSYEMSSDNEIDEKIVLRGIWDISSMKRVDQIPFNIDGTKCYEIVGKNRSDVLNKLRDGRPWKRDSRSNWTGYKSVRYRDCRGGSSCPNVNCTFFLQFHDQIE